jgi:hypothetical protein
MGPGATGSTVPAKLRRPPDPDSKWLAAQGRANASPILHGIHCYPGWRRGAEPESDSLIGSTGSWSNRP